ncbi:hypothetical protein WICMUC_000796 [Wickerhamomyces mucosus]|uniref:Outer spore wall assembly protein SHE10 n=1 Tax=Wickerhamomyces mucosus TaxID=1378264 RepID=A0A9P8TII6_9ASCO|nr:hypothetical protein WICMUC_000796 [Wickerhamomyces mucosus]
MFRKLLLLLSLVILVSFTVDFQSKEFDPIRGQLNSSLVYAKSNHYYNEYVSPLTENYACPIYKNVNNQYIAPSLLKLNEIVTDQYQAHVSNHVSTITESVVKSPVFEKYLTFKPHLVDFYKKIDGYSKVVNNYTTTYLATSIIHVLKSINIVSEKIITFDYNGRYHCFKSCSSKFYQNKVVPISIDIYEQVVKYTGIFYKYAQFYIRIVNQHLINFHKQHFAPFWNTSIKPHVELYYNKYIGLYYNQFFAPYINVVYVEVVKYYNLLRINQALSLSKIYIINSYNQLWELLQKDDSTKNLTSVDETFASINDTPTSFNPEETAAIVEPITENEPSIDLENASAIEVDGSIPVETDSLVKRQFEEQQEIVVSLVEEISSWKEFIDESIENIFKNFETSVNQIEKAKISILKPELTELLQDLTSTSQDHFNEINKAILNINSKTALLENGQEAELDKNGIVLDHKISRQEFRDLLSKAQENSKKLAEIINSKLKEVVSDIEIKIDLEKNLIVDIYEEFAEVAINEFSKKMMYSTYSSSFNRFENEGENFDDWKDYIKIKRSIIEQREELIQTKPSLTDINNLLNEIKFTLKTLAHEQGDYFAILRAKANIEFQEREKREREELKKIEDEDYTSTQTILKYKTIGQDGVEIEPTSKPSHVDENDEIVDVSEDTEAPVDETSPEIEHFESETSDDSEHPTGEPTEESKIQENEDAVRETVTKKDESTLVPSAEGVEEPSESTHTAKVDESVDAVETDTSIHSEHYKEKEEETKERTIAVVDTPKARSINIDE